MATTTYEPIATQTASGSTNIITFSSIPQTYTDLVLVCSVQVTAATDDFNIQFNGETTGTNYSHTQLFGNGSSPYSTRNSNTNKFRIADYMPNSTLFGTIVANIQNYSNSTTYKTVVSRWGNGADATGGNIGLWRSTSAITSFTLSEGSTQNIKAGSTFTLYGIANADSGAKATGGVITYDDTYYYHTFGASGTFTPKQSLTNVDYLVIAGGGAGGVNNAGGGGGGAGGLRSTVGVTGGGGTLESKISLNSGTAYTISVGAGGAAITNNTYNSTRNNGTDSSIAGTGLSTITATGGGGGSGGNLNGATGGSGGGADGGYALSGGSGTSNQGYAGGNGSTTPYYVGGGGGGAGAAGNNGNTNVARGGNGVQITEIATTTGTGVNGYYAGGGNGGGENPSIVTTAGSLGGGGAGGRDGNGGTGNGTNGAVNTGSGGGGAEWESGASKTSGQGGSGLVVIRYLKA